MNPQATEEADVAIVGGAFSGATTAILLKRADPSLRVVIIETKESFDRKVGESAIELSSWFMTRVLGLNRHLSVEQLPKYGLRFWFSNEKVRTLADASELGNLYQTRIPSHHIDRARLDEHVLSIAAAEGVRLMRPARVEGIHMIEGGPSELKVVEGSAGSAERQETTVTARWVVDATGRRTWLARHLGLRQEMPEHPIHSVWARYQGLRDFDSGWLPAGDCDKRLAFCSRGLSTNHLTGLGWWVWVIPLPGGDTSVGVVWDERLFSLPEGPTVAARFESFLSSFPAGKELMAGARRIEGDLHQLNNLPYRVTQIMGDGWAMVGDAAGFLDPFYSMGLDWAGLTAAHTARVVVQALAVESRTKQSPAQAIAQITAHHNALFTRGFYRWFEALYQDKYYYLGDAELMEIALRLDVALYYFGVVTPPYRMGTKGFDVPFSLPVSYPFYRLMRFVNRRLASVARARIAAGTWGRANAGRRVLLPGFRLGPASLRYVPGALARLAWLEVCALPDRLGLRRSRRTSEEDRETPATAASPSAARPR